MEQNEDVLKLDTETTTPEEDANHESIDEAELDEPSEEAEEALTETGDKPKKQSKADNARFAEARRQREKALQQDKVAKEKEIYDQGYRKAQLDANKENPYTGDPITNDHELEVYLTMKELDEQGKDPLKAFPKYWADKLTEADNKAKADKEKAEAEEKAKLDEKKRIDDDIAKQKADLKKAHPEIDIANLAKDEKFMAYGKDKFGRWTYTEIVEGWLEKHPIQSENKARKSSPTSTLGGSKTEKSIKDMTDDEYEAYSRKVYGSF